jgi:hypothetical protein
MYATYWREYNNFTHLLYTVVGNNMRANVFVLLYDDHNRAMKLLQSLDRIIWDGKVDTIPEFENYDTLVVNELFSKLNSTEVDHGVIAHLERLTNSHSLAVARVLSLMLTHPL